jgi:DNA-binding transcriptional LysR family regulator
VYSDIVSTTSSIHRLLNLLSFVRVVEAGSFAEAARRAGTTTSAMSKAVARFEAANGIRLLHRTTHALSLTDEGERLLEGARDLLREAERLEASLEEAGDKGARGRVRISAPGSFIRACLSPLLPSLLKENPRIELELKFEDAPLDLGSEGVDIALRTGSLAGQPGLVARRLMTFPWVLCASPTYLAHHGAPKTPADLKEHHQIGFRHSGTGQLVTWLFSTRGSSPSAAPIRHVPRNRLIVGIGWVPAWCGLDDLRSGRVVELLREWRVPETPLSAVRLERRHTPRRTHRVLEFLSRAASAWEYR